MGRHRSFKLVTAKTPFWCNLLLAVVLGLGGIVSFPSTPDESGWLSYTLLFIALLMIGLRLVRLQYTDQE